MRISKLYETLRLLFLRFIQESKCLIQDGRHFAIFSIPNYIYNIHRWIKGTSMSHNNFRLQQDVYSS